MINKNVLLEYKEPMCHNDMMEYLEVLSTRYRFLRIIYIGKSMHGKSIPIVKIGTGEKNIIYTAGVNGNEMLTGIMMMRFINEFCEYIRTEQRVYNVSLDYIFRTRSIYIAPMINPDGVEMRRFDREDKSKADIKPIAAFAETLSNIKLMAAFRLNGNYIACPDINAEGMQSLTKLYARMTGCEITDNPCVINSKNFPVFDISCGSGELFTTYMRVREFLFTAPILC